MKLLKKKPELNETRLKMPNGRNLTFNGFWNGFDPNLQFASWPHIIDKYCEKKDLRILGPFWKQRDYYFYKNIAQNQGKWDFFITGENRDNPYDLAKKCIGFRLPNNTSQVRFPYWQWYLNWQNIEIKKPYKRFDEVYSISKLMEPISQNFGQISIESFRKSPPKAVLITSHLKHHRLKLYINCRMAIGCDLYGKKFIPMTKKKKDLLSSYKISICPENSLGQGYITEKIPEAFLSGNIPVTYCNPSDLILDFNPKAVINLYGLSGYKIRKKLKEISSNFEIFTALRNEPLLLTPPCNKPLINLLSKHII
jgi:hypothetical protein